MELDQVEIKEIISKHRLEIGELETALKNTEDKSVQRAINYRLSFLRDNVARWMLLLKR